LVPGWGEHDPEFFWQYIVADPSFKPDPELPQTTPFTYRLTQLQISREKVIAGRVINVFWKGDKDLTSELNTDSNLINRLAAICGHRNSSPIIDAISSVNHENMEIFMQDGFAVISSLYRKQGPEDIEAMNIIAKHIKSAWFS
jgi:hypothetical protein